MELVPSFPAFAPVVIEMSSELIPFFDQLSDGICEYTFASLFLDSYKYRYNISCVSKKTYIVTGIDPIMQKREQGNEPPVPCGADQSFAQHRCRFFSLIGDLPDEGLFQTILNDRHIATCCYLKNFAESSVVAGSDMLKRLGLIPVLDRDNCDYLYNRDDLVFLRGKAFHKKKNHVNGFYSQYLGLTKILDSVSVSDAFSVLNRWKSDRMTRGEIDDGDFLQCSLALQYLNELRLSGIVVYADGSPAGFSLGEQIAGGTLFCTHFEKGIDSVNGIYQVVNNEQAKVLPETVMRINREQDLGDEGLRQAKMTYRPCGFVNKYKVCLHRSDLMEK